MKVVIVESPAKAKTINKYLGSDYKVLASYGHIRDLPSKSGSVDPEHHFHMIWESEERAQKTIQEIAKAVKNADTLFLATDPDREGEAISWHVKEVLTQEKALDNVDIKRIVFYEVTKRAVHEALQSPRQLNQGLIEAYLARRALDYLVGFTLSPVLWTKLPGSRSAGRVQSVALRLVAEREAEIETFIREEYWSITALFQGAPNKKVLAKLSHYHGQKLDKLDIKHQAQAADIVAFAEKQVYAVKNVEKKRVNRYPSPPFITSTLQQEASRKLRFSPRKTMKVAQQLYEGIEINGDRLGLITYMRTDSTTIAQEAIAATRRFIEQTFTKEYLPSSPRFYKSKAKNAQEAHEAIRPTDVTLTPDRVKNFLDADQSALYELIWKRLVASQMENAVFEQVSVDIAPADDSLIFRATGSVIQFDGFLKLYEEGQDEEADEDNPLLPPLSEKEPLELTEITPHQHFTQPPARYTEASLVKKLEELGIGRPSTYASILSTLIDRQYVRLEKRHLVPETLGRLVTSFLKEYFRKYVEYDFTAELEAQLDEISQGNLDWQTVMRDFWHAFHEQVSQAKELKISDVIHMLDHNLESYLFPKQHPEDKPRLCPSCHHGTLSLKLGKFGGFIGCSNYPECTYTRQIPTAETKPAPDTKPTAETTSTDTTTESITETKPATKATEPIELGNDPQTGELVTLRKGPYGFYFQWGNGLQKQKPMRIALPKNLSPQQIRLEDALKLKALPRTVGQDPDTGEVITVGVGRFGPYVKRGSTFVSLGNLDDMFSLTLEQALELFAQATEKASQKSRDSIKNGRVTGSQKQGVKKQGSARRKNSSVAKTAQS